jgi:hypothetical protein
VKECIMRRVSLLALLAVILFTAITSAQTATPFNPARPAAIFVPALETPVNPDIVVARLMTFDRDNDGRLVRSELPERMQSVLAGDTSGDQALDRDEIRALARPAAPAALAATFPGFRGGGPGGGYTFGDQVSLSTRAHVEGALDDLRLTPVQHRQALAIVRPFMDALEADAEAALLRELEGLMSPGQLGSFKVMLERRMTGGNVMPAQIITRSDGVKVNVARFFGPDLSQMINSFALPPDRTSLALASLDSFKARIRPGEPERVALLRQLKAVLSDEERENFGAALQRRPLVKANQMFAGVVGGVVGGFVPRPPPPPVPTLPGDVVSPLVVRPQQVLEP